MKIYLLEDNEVFIKQFCKLLKRKNIEYITCSCMDLYKYEKADIYIIDLQVWSEMSYRAIKDIRSKTNNPIALLTHHTDRDKIKMAVDNGVSYIISKFDYQLYWIHLDLLSKMKTSWNTRKP